MPLNLLGSYLLLIICFIVLIVIAYYFFSSIIAMVRTKGVPYVPTYTSDLKYFKNLPIENVKNKKIVDLGCGDGKMLRYFKINYNFEVLDGYDLNGFAINYGNFVNHIKKINNINLFKDNFKKANLKEYDYVFVYLLPETMKAIESRVFENIKEDAIIISNTFGFVNHEPYFSIKNKNGNSRVLFYKR